MLNEDIEVSVYTKEQVLKSERFRDSCDLLAIKLEDDRTYALAEIETIVKDFKMLVITERKNGGSN